MSEPLWETLAQVRAIRRVAERRSFRGYSGRARAACGIVAIAGAWMVTQPPFSGSDWMTLKGWALVAAVALGINLVAVVHWFLYDPEVARNRERLTPLFEILPPLLIGGVLTLNLADQGAFQPLFGVWMLLFGLVNFYAYPLLPRAIRTLGLFYIASGLAFLMLRSIEFSSAWPMALVFGCGELVGGAILHRHREPSSHWSEVFIPRRRNAA